MGISKKDFENTSKKIKIDPEKQRRWKEYLNKKHAEFRNLKSQKQISLPATARDRNNNKIEKLNGEFRDREKIVRGIKTKDSVLIHGYQMYHNYLRPHEGLEGKTPSESCGITIHGRDKWKTLIQNASKS